MNNTIESLIILSILAVVLIILATLYSISTFRRMSIAYKKLDYLIEDLTYKSETLNTTVETIAKVSNYLDSFEVIAHKNVKAGIKLFARNKDLFYDLGERLRQLAIIEAEKVKKAADSRIVSSKQKKKTEKERKIKNTIKTKVGK